MPLGKQKNKPNLLPFILIFSGFSFALQINGPRLPLFTAISSFLIFIGFSAFLFDRYSKNRPVNISLLALPLFMSFLFGLGMLIPVPDILRQLLSPNSFEYYSQIHAALEEKYRLLMLPFLAIAPPDTAHAVTQLATALLLIIFLGDRLRSRHNLNLTYWLIFFTALILCFTAFGHSILDFKLIWGTFKNGGTPIFAPLVNPNHLASLFGGISFLLFAGAAYLRNKYNKYWFALLGIICGATVFLTLSRGAILTYMLVVFALCWIAFIFKKYDSQSMQPNQGSPKISLSTAIWTPICLLLTLATAIYVAQEQIFNELYTLHENDSYIVKWQIYQPMLDVIKNHWLSGVGQAGLRGVYFSSLDYSLANQPDAFLLNHNIPYFENIVLQTLADYGIVKFFIFATFLIFLIYKITKFNYYSWSLIFLYAGIAFLVISDLFDFFLETGVGLWLLALFTGFVAADLSKHGFKNFNIRPKYMLISYCLLTLIIAPISIYSINNYRPDLDKEQKAYENKEDRIDFIKTALAVHPRDTYFTLLLAALNRQEKNYIKSQKWAEIAINQKPINFKATLELARSYWGQNNKSEALKTYKKVWIINPTQATKVLREAYTMRSDIRDLLSVIPAYTPQYLEPYCHFLNHEFNSKTSLTCFQHLIKLENTTDQQILTTINLAMKNQEFILAYNLLTKNLKATLDIPKYQKHFAHLESAWLGEKVALEDTDEWGFDTLESCPLIRWRFAAAQSVNDKKRALSSLEKLSRCPQYADARQLKYLKLSMHNAFHEHGQALKILQSLNNVLTPELGLLLRQANKEIHLKLYKRAESTYKKMVQQNPTNASVISLGKKLANIENEKQEQWLRKGL